MFFTQEDYLKIQQWLQRNSVKDTEFQEAADLIGNEVVTLVQNGSNKKVYLKDLVNQIFSIGVTDFINVSSLYEKYNITLSGAIKLVPYKSRKRGQVITFLNTDGNWEIYQFTGVKNQWNNIELWKDLFDWQTILNISFEADEEDITSNISNEEEKIKLSFKNREYDPLIHSGLGYKILRKNIVQYTDPTHGELTKNILYQNMISNTYTIYEIRYDFDLEGNTINIPEGCVLQYKGGSLSNGTLIYEDTIIEGVERLSNVNIEGNYRYPYTGDESNPDTQLAPTMTQFRKLNTQVNNIADDEDLTKIYDDEKGQEVLQLKDRKYVQGSNNGMGYVILRQNKSFKEQLTQSNTIYEIRYDFDFGGEEVEIPENCVLKFEGGALKNGIVIGKATRIKSELYHILTNITLKGEWAVIEYYPEWFGAVGDGTTDDTNALQSMDGLSIRLGVKTYLARNLTYGKKTEITGNGRALSILKQKDGSTGDFITLLDWSLGKIENICVEGGVSISERNFQQALIKIKTSKGNPTESSFKSVITNISVINSEYNGISILGYGQIDNGIECGYNWVFTMSNVFVQDANRVCIYNKSTDNQFNNINCRFGGWADIIEEGGSNNWNNIKLDGEAGFKINSDDLEVLLKDRTKGAALILNGGGSHFSNLDVQSSSYTGVKIFDTRLCSIIGHINNCGIKSTNSNFSPALYLSGLYNSRINLIFNRYTYQYKQLVCENPAYVRNNEFTLIYQKTQNDNYEFDFELLRRNNTVINNNQLDRNPIYRYLKNLISTDITSGKTFVNAEVVNDGAIFGGNSPAIRMGKGYSEIVNEDNIDATVFSLYLIIAVVKKEDNINNTLKPYIVAQHKNVNEDDYSNLESVRCDNVGELNFGEKKVIAFLCSPTKTQLRFKIVKAENSGVYSVANIRMYNITQDFGMNGQYDLGSYSVLDTLFASYKDYLNGEREFADVPVRHITNSTYLPDDCGKSSCRPPYANIGSFYFDTTLNKPIWHIGNGKWVDATGATV